MSVVDGVQRLDVEHLKPGLKVRVVVDFRDASLDHVGVVQKVKPRPDVSVTAVEILFEDGSSELMRGMDYVEVL